MKSTDQEIFEAIIQREGNFTFVALPFSPRAVWGARPRYPVAGTINQIPVSGTLGALGQNYFLRLSATWLRKSGVEVGATVTVTLSVTPPEGKLAPPAPA